MWPRRLPARRRSRARSRLSPAFSVGPVCPPSCAATARAARSHRSRSPKPRRTPAARERVHMSDVGGVSLELRGGSAVETAYAEMARALGDAMGGAVVQPMVPSGVETIVGVTHDPSFGPIVLFGLGGVTAELL